MCVRLECAVCMSDCIGCECEVCVRCEVCWVYVGCAFMGVCVRCLMCGYEYVVNICVGYSVQAVSVTC